MILTDWEAIPLAELLVKAADIQNVKRQWSTVRVPGHWQLEANFVAYDGYVLYRCRFVAQHTTPELPASFLRFGGVYYSARVWLNGNYLGSHEGYFSAFEFDVTDVLAPDGENELLVEVHSPEEPDENDRMTVGGVWAMWDGMAAHYNPGGIFREVSLVRSGELRIRQLEATADHMGNGRSVVEIYARRGSYLVLEGQIFPVGFDAPDAGFRREVWAEPGLNRFEVEFRLPEARAWWTWDRGGQPLYELTLACGDAEEKVRFGARTVELRNWIVYLNGERLFLRGINYLPTDVFPARASVERLWADAALVRDAGMNAARVHAHIAEVGFYEACDELGILILQDFPMQWTHRRSVLEPAVAQAGEMSSDLQSHPSVGIYLAHDEPFYVAPPEKWSVFGLVRTAAEVASPRWLLWQRRVLGPAVMRAISEEDGSRPVIDAAGHPLTTNHLYFGWYYGKFRDLERLVKILPGFSRLPTEYGAQALPDLETLAEIWPAGRKPDWEGLTVNYRLQVDRMMRYVPWRDDREAFVRESQEYQAMVLKHATELFRRRKYKPTGGTFAFMLNDPAPAISWSVVDWRRRPKAAYETLKVAMQPVLVCVEYPDESYEVGATISLPLYVVNDLSKALTGVTVGWDLHLGDGRVASGGVEVEIPADSVKRVGEVKARLSGQGSAKLRLSLSGNWVNVDNVYEFIVVS
ncbi:MAG: beta galactosidase jelly roll domain-containing protein [Rubrobacter sp.]|nr:beta galactosidase jelly roll domain-containing protein [Rubrobacter sp.]